MLRLASRRHRARGITPSIDRRTALMMLRLVRDCLQAGRIVRPRSVVQRLLLAPQQVRVRVAVQMRSEEVVRQRAELLNAGDRMSEKPELGDEYLPSL
jgi:hypothetical protein